MKKYDLVVARYNENLEWLDSLDPERYNIIIYNKGLDDIKYPFIPLENIGRESQTFIYYIVEHYDNLPNFVIFVQGNPLDHDPKVFEKMNQHIRERVLVLSNHFIEEHISGWYTKYMDYPTEYNITHLYKVAHKILGHANLVMCGFGAGAQYIVKSSIIKRRSKEFYQKILDMYKDDYFLPWHMERLFLYVIQAIEN